MKKKIISVICMISILSGIGLASISAKNDGITVVYDGKEISFDVEPEIINNRVMVPMRAVFEAFGAKVKWSNAEKKITAKKKSKTVDMTIGSKEMTKNDEIYEFDTAPVIVDGRTLVPIRAIGEMLGVDVEWNEDTKTVYLTSPSSEEDDSWKENTGSIDLDTMSVSGNGTEVLENIITITQGGDFEVTGTADNAGIVINTKDKVKLRLSGMSLTNPNGAAIYVKDADKAYITLTEGTENFLYDGETYTSGDDNEKACITARDTLEIKGKGSLTINAVFNHGIDSSDSLEIANGNITINAKNDGIHVNDTLSISGGTLTVTAEGDGIQSDEIIDITGGTVDITTTGDVPAATVRATAGGFGMNMTQNGTDPRNMSDEERKAFFEEIRKSFENEVQENADASDEESEDITSKGIKADWLLEISGGDISVVSTDHAIHCKSDITINGGNITLSSTGNKGISSHGDIVINDGNIDITKATEGIETKQLMTVNGGNISITASDDGLNAGGGSRNEMFGRGQREGNASQGTAGENGNIQRGNRMMPPDIQNGGANGENAMTPPDMQNGDMQRGNRMIPPDMQNSGANGENSNNMTQPPTNGGMGGFGGFGGNSTEISSERHIQINGGNIYINAKNDGIDSNGSIEIAGGTVIIEGTPFVGADSGIDADMAAVISGGEVFATGTGIGEKNAKQNTVMINHTAQNGALMEIKDESGKTIAKRQFNENFYSVLYSSSALVSGKTYYVYADNEKIGEFTVSSALTTVGESAGGFGGFGGMRGQRGQNTQSPQTGASNSL